MIHMCEAKWQELKKVHSDFLYVGNFVFLGQILEWK